MSTDYTTPHARLVRRILAIIAGLLAIAVLAGIAYANRAAAATRPVMIQDGVYGSFSRAYPALSKRVRAYQTGVSSVPGSTHAVRFVATSAMRRASLARGTWVLLDLEPGAVFSPPADTRHPAHAERVAEGIASARHWHLIIATALDLASSFKHSGDAAHWYVRRSGLPQAARGTWLIVQTQSLQQRPAEFAWLYQHADAEHGGSAPTFDQVSSSRGSAAQAITALRAAGAPGFYMRCQGADLAFEAAVIRGAA